MSKKSNQLKKFAILFCTFIVPLLFFLFLASGKVNFEKLPILTEKISGMTTTDLLRNKVSVISIVGTTPNLATYQKMLNLYQVIYKSTSKYRKFQVVTLVPESNTALIPILQSELEKVGGVALEKWQFVSLPTAEIQQVYNSFESPAVFDPTRGISEVYIIDEDLNLRGRTDDEDVASGILFGYDTGSVAVLKNKLREDLKVLFYESKFAVKESKLN